MVLVWQSEGVLELAKARAVLSLHGNSLHADSVEDMRVAQTHLLPTL